MRTNIALIILSLVLIIVCTVCVFTMRTTALDLILCAQTAAEALPQDSSAASDALVTFNERWQRARLRWQLFAIHDDLDEVSLAYTEAVNALNAGEFDDAISACGRLIIALEAILNKEMPTLGNIL